MRFSAAFTLPLPPARPPEPGAPVPAAAATPVPPVPQGQAAALPELPDELDARVRLVGEWQLGEG